MLNFKTKKMKEIVQNIQNIDSKIFIGILPITPWFRFLWAPAVERIFRKFDEGVLVDPG